MIIRLLQTISFLLLAGMTLLYGQINSDSLLDVSKTISDDAERAKFLKEQSADLLYADFKDPIAYIMEQLSIAKRLDVVEEEVWYAMDLINAANYVGQFSLGDSLVFHYVSKAKELENKKLSLDLYYEASKASFFNQQYGQGIHYDTLALALVPSLTPLSIQDSVRAQIHNYLGKSYNASGQFVPAALVLSEGIELIRSNWPKADVLREMYTELGIVYSQIGLYDQAVDYLDQNRALSESQEAKAIADVNIARNLLLTHDYPAARDRYFRVISYNFETADKGIYLSYAYNGLIEAYHEMKEPDSISHYFQKYSSLLEENPELKNVNSFLYKQSSLLYQLANKKLAEAEQNGLELYDEAVAKNDPAEQLMYTGWLADLYRQRGDFRSADRYSQELAALKDSIQGANRNNALLLYYNQFETKEKENDILRLEVERQQVSASRKLYQTTAGLLSLLLLVGGYFFFRLRRARQKLSVQNDELNKLNATKDRFFSIIAHDLRNPIVALSTAGHQVNKLLERGKTDTLKRVIGNVSETTARLNGLLDNLLKWALSQSKDITLNKESLSLHQLINGQLDLYRSAANEKGIALRNKVVEDIMVTADNDALQAILRNLLGNAVKFSPSGQSSEVAFAYREEGKMNVVTVSDQGPGISEEVQEQLFTLHQGKEAAGRRKPGAGLGLILCRELAELHGGRIELNSKPSEGASFSVWLPKS